MINPAIVEQQVAFYGNATCIAWESEIKLKFQHKDIAFFIIIDNDSDIVHVQRLEGLYIQEMPCHVSDIVNVLAAMNAASEAAKCRFTTNSLWMFRQ